jgi:hypothetical protein
MRAPVLRKPIGRLVQAPPEETQLLRTLLRCARARGREAEALHRSSERQHGAGHTSAQPPPEADGSSQDGEGRGRADDVRDRVQPRGSRLRARILLEVVANEIAEGLVRGRLELGEHLRVRRLEVGPHALLGALEHDRLLGCVDVTARFGEPRVELVPDLRTQDVPLRARMDEQRALRLLGDAHALHGGAQARRGLVEDGRDRDERAAGEHREDDEDHERLRDDAFEGTPA